MATDTGFFFAGFSGLGIVLVMCCFWTPAAVRQAANGQRLVPGGVQLIALGILGEYLGRILRWKLKNRPLYIVADTYGVGRTGQG
jgi:hypothetical protein